MLRISSVALLAVLGFAAFNLPAQAEDGPPPARKEGREGRPGRGGPERMERMLLEGITLSEDQKAALEKLHTEAREARKKAAEGEKKDLTPEERRAAMKAGAEKHRAAVRSVLTADQAKTFDENVKKMEARRAEMEKNGGGRRRGEGKPEGKPEAKEEAK